MMQVRKGQIDGEFGLFKYQEKLAGSQHMEVSERQLEARTEGIEIEKKKFKGQLCNNCSGGG